MTVDEWLRECWGNEYPLFKKAAAKYPPPAFVSTAKEKAERAYLILKYIRNHYGLTR